MRSKTVLFVGCKLIFGFFLFIFIKNSYFRNNNRFLSLETYVESYSELMFINIWNKLSKNRKH